MHDTDTYHYYREVLEPLFFQTMNTKRPGDITHWEGIRIPYLNGGLFDKARDPAGPILIPDAIFDPNDVNGLLGFFNRYNFTIANDTPLEQDVAVDPEMLGKVFENCSKNEIAGSRAAFTRRARLSPTCVRRRWQAILRRAPTSRARRPAPCSIPTPTRNSPPTKRSALTPRSTR